MSDDSGDAILQMPWARHTPKLRYQIITQCNRITFCDGGLAVRDGDTWRVVRDLALQEASRFVALMSALTIEYGADYFDHDKSEKFTTGRMWYDHNRVGYTVLSTGETVSFDTFKSRIASGRYEQLKTE